MSTKNLYPEYAAIEQHIRSANIERVIPIAEAIAEFIVDCWYGLKAPPRTAAIIIEGRYPWTGFKGNQDAWS